MEWLSTTLNSNQYFSAGFGLIGLTAGLAVLRRTSIQLLSSFKKHAFCVCEITSNDISYNWLLKFISNNYYRHQISVQTNHNFDLNLVPAPGKFMMRYNNKWIHCERTRSETPNINNQHFEIIKLTCFGRDIQVFKDLLHETRICALQENLNKTITFIPIGHEWRQFGHPRPSRPLESVILNKEIKDLIINDLESFISSSKWYYERGIPYKRGYLLYGPPGTGKTSLIFSLAGFLNYSICVLNLSDRTLTDDRLIYLLTNAPLRSIIVLEDIDLPFRIEATRQENSKIYEGLTRITFSGLLNGLDGIISSEGRIIFGTTNSSLNDINSTLIRPGRFDLKLLIGYVSDYQLQEAFKHFYPDSYSDDLIKTFIKNVRNSAPNDYISMAQIQAHFLLYKNDPHSAAFNKISI